MGHQVPLLRRSLANATRLTHWLISFFIMLGWTLPWPLAWWVHVILTPLVRAHWRFNERTCILTTWEHRLLGIPLDESHEEGWFVHILLRLVYRGELSNEFVRRLMFWVMWLGTAISTLRLAEHHNLL